MPWNVREGYNGCRGWAVVNTSTQEVVGCHPNDEDAQAQVRALYANEAVKVWDGSAFGRGNS
jgi:hypothetical protein